MKDISLMKNYRLKYKRYFGIDFGSEMVVHHIDFDRQNNDISNLLLLPKELHAKYHMILNALSVSPDKTKADGFIDFRISNVIATHYNANMLALLPETINECSKWIDAKNNNYIGFRR